MDTYEKLRETALTVLVRDTPKEFWVDLKSFGPLVYADTFAEVNNDESIVDDQKLNFLLQRRHFRMEKMLVDIALRHGLFHSMNVILQNNYPHAYVYNGDVSMTQSYVQAIGNLPQPAKFREKFAESMALPRLDLGDEPDGAYIIRNMYGLVAHNPVGRRFREEEQRMGMLQFCLPSKDCMKWAIEFSTTDIISAYPSDAKNVRALRSLPWKENKQPKGSGVPK